MATDNGDEHAPMGSGLDYKTVSVALASVLIGLIWAVLGFWNSRSEQAVEDSRTTNEHQWQSIQHLREEVLGIISDHKQFRREGDDREERLRHNEHAISKLEHELAQLKEKRR